jgi:hypothetical protein
MELFCRLLRDCYIGERNLLIDYNWFVHRVRFLLTWEVQVVEADTQIYKVYKIGLLGWLRIDSV